MLITELKHPQPSQLVIMFFVTGGQNGENLGSDEAQIVFFVYMLYDVANNRVVSMQSHYVRPNLEMVNPGDREVILTEECRIQTDLSEIGIRKALSLDQILDEFDRFLITKNIHPDHSGRPFTLLCDGQLHLRLCLHPESYRKNIQLAPYFNRFYDLRKEFKTMYNLQVVNCIKDMLDFNKEPQSQHTRYGERHCQDMAAILSTMINDGHQFGPVDLIKDRLEAGICTKDELVDDETVIRARGLPWQSSDQDIANFFRGLNVARGGVALCLSQQGRRNGEALVRFECKEHRDLALRKHKHHLNQRYIEVYRASGADFINVAGGSNTEAQQFLEHFGENGEQVIIRMRGLPYSCTTQQVLDFFAQAEEEPVMVLDGEQGVLFVHQADGRATGDAFVLFGSEDEAAKAIQKHRQTIGQRYIELFKSTTAEVQQVLNRSMDPRSHIHENTSNNNNEDKLFDLTLYNPYSTIQALGAQPAILGAHPAVYMPQQLITSGSAKDCIRLRGLPFEATVTEILGFLGEHARSIMFQGVHMVYDAQGTPSGEAFIQMNSEAAAENATLQKHKKYMLINNKRRFIEVFQCSGEDMNHVLTSGIIPSTIPGGNGPPLQQQLMQLPQSQATFALPALPGTQGVSPVQSPLMVQKAMSFQTETRVLAPGNGVLGAGPLTAAQLPTAVPASPPAQALQGMGGMAQYYNPYAPVAINAQGGLMGSMATPQGTILTSSASSNAILAQPNSVTAFAMPPPGVLAPGAAGLMAQPQMAHRPTMLGTPQGAIPYATAAPIANGASPIAMSPNGLQQVLYWCPSPPNTPQNGTMGGYYYTAASPSTVVVKGLTSHSQPQDVLSLLDGVYQVQPDVQIQGSEAYVTFASRHEAERAVIECNRKVLHNRLVEIHMA